MAALLFSELNSYIDNNVIDEIGVTLDPTLPPIFLVDTKLGIAKSVLKSVFFYAMGQMNTLRSLLYNANQSDGHYAMWSSLLNATRIVLIVKGDHPSAYDMRKRMICMWQLPVQKELSFTSLLFTRHPKCPSGWQHRRWCLSRNSYLRNETVQLLPAAVETERELCRSMAEAHPKNYYAWVHRLWLLPFLSKYQIEDELFFTRDWLKSHVSDHSAVNHRIQVINQILLNAELLSHVSNPLVPGDGPEAEAEAEAETAHTEGNNLTQQLRFLASMFMHSAEVITTRPGHEALWCLRRSLLEILFQTIQNQVLTFCGFGLKQLLMGTKIPRTSLHLEISAQVKNEADGVLVGVHSFDALDKAVKGLDRPGDQLPSPNLSRSLSTHPIIGAKSRAPIIAWLASFLAEEMRLGGVCAQDAAAWDYEAQRLMALRYVAFLLDRTTHYFVADADVDIVASQGASTDGNYDGDCKCSCDCDHSTDIDITGGSLVEQREVASGVASGVAVASTDLMAMLPLRVLLKEELQQVCEQLQLEDKRSHLWSNKRSGPSLLFSLQM